MHQIGKGKCRESDQDFSTTRVITCTWFLRWRCKHLGFDRRLHSNFILSFCRKVYQIFSRRVVSSKWFLKFHFENLITLGALTFTLFKGTFQLWIGRPLQLQKRSLFLKRKYLPFSKNNLLRRGTFSYLSALLSKNELFSKAYFFHKCTFLKNVPS